MIKMMNEDAKIPEMIHADVVIVLIRKWWIHRMNVVTMTPTIPLNLIGQIVKKGGREDTTTKETPTNQLVKSQRKDIKEIEVRFLQHYLLVLEKRMTYINPEKNEVGKKYHSHHVMLHGIPRIDVLPITTLLI